MATNESKRPTPRPKTTRNFGESMVAAAEPVARDSSPLCNHSTSGIDCALGTTATQLADPADQSSDGGCARPSPLTALPPGTIRDEPTFPARTLKHSPFRITDKQTPLAGLPPWIPAYRRGGRAHAHQRPNA
jgi:hypothetical protein